jgi:light-regulated signal transduction histidine kinase (bacteriophytochrome)
MGEILYAVIKSIRQKNQERKINWLIHEMPVVKADISLMKIVWENLLDNAIKFSSKRTESIIEIKTLEQEAEYVFSIRDNGIGMDMKYAQKLFGVFQRFHSTDEFEGSGIGLAIVRRVISRHGGRIWAESQLNNGSVFNFSLIK